ncbi:MAG: efflux RND transporter periplasmic adaptor subunit, partial [Verrucomicrobiota bacterium]
MTFSIKRISKWLTSLGGIALLALAAWVSLGLLKTPPKAKREKPKTKAPRVSVVPLSRSNEPVTIRAFGSVMAARELTVRAQIRGLITEAHPHLVPGGTLKQGESIVRIEPTDFEIAVQRAEAALTEAKVECEIEHGRQIVAKREWELLKGKNGDPSSSGLALRKPQLQKVEAALAKAKAELDEAKLDLERTNVKVPFDAVVIREAVESGQLIETQT